MDQQKRIFDPTVYLNQFYNTPEGSQQEKELFENIQKWMKQAFEIMEPCQFGIEIGCGPILQLAAFSSKKIKNLVLTQYNTECFKYVNGWVNGQKQQGVETNWNDYLKLISSLQGTTTQQIQNRLKKCLVGCLKIDLRKDDIFQYPFFRKVNAIVSSFCLESAAQDTNKFKRMIKNLKKYLQPNGYFFQIGVMEETYYKVGERKLPCFYVTKQLLQEIMKEQGFEIIKLHVVKTETPPTQSSDFKGFFALLGQLKQKK